MFFNKLSGLVRGQSDSLPTHRFVEKVVSTLGESITAATNFEPTLSQALHAAELYYYQQIQAIPGPFDISASEPRESAFFKTIFPAPEDVQIALGRSIEVRDFLPALVKDGKEEFFGLLGVREKTARDGEANLLFADHTIRSIGHSEDYCRESLRKSCLHRLIGQFREHVDTLRVRGQMPASAWNIENRITSGDSASGDMVLASDALQPDSLLKGLVAWLESPENHLRIESSNIVLPDQSGGGTELPVMRCADRRHWVVSLVQVPVQDALAALASESRCHRYILI